MNREKFKEKAKKKIDEIFAKIDDLEAKKDLAVGQTKIEYEKKIAELKLKKDELSAKYDKLVNATEENWEEVKTAFSDASKSFKNGFSSIFSIFRKKDNKCC